jgi:hypothetical protein
LAADTLSIRSVARYSTVWVPGSSNTIGSAYACQSPVPPIRYSTLSTPAHPTSPAWNVSVAESKKVFGSLGCARPATLWLTFGAWVSSRHSSWTAKSILTSCVSLAPSSWLRQQPKLQRAM